MAESGAMKDYEPILSVGEEVAAIYDDAPRGEEEETVATLFNLLTQDDRVRCFANVAAHLTDDGVFVVETLVPTYLMRLRNDQYVGAEALGVAEVRLDVGRHDPVRQMLE